MDKRRLTFAKNEKQQINEQKCNSRLLGELKMSSKEFSKKFNKFGG